MQVAVHAYRIKDLDFAQNPDAAVNNQEVAALEENLSVSYVLKNALNNILDSIDHSTHAILEDTNSIADDNKRLLLIILCVASSALLISICLIFPVVTKVRKNKDELLTLFLEIESADVRE